jgi:heparanase
LKQSRWPQPLTSASLLLLVAATSIAVDAQTPAPTLKPATMPRVGSIDERFQSYNIEMLEVTGGRFWKPYNAPKQEQAPSTSSAPSAIPGMDPNLYAYRPPKDLSNHRLRAMATALGPAYVRVSGTWANSSYFPPTDEAPATPPAGFGGVLTHQQWKGVVDFAHNVNANIITSFATSVGTRDASGQWNSEQAQRFVDYTRSIGGHIAAAEYMNEPTFAGIGGAPKGYNGQDYGRDFKAFHQFASKSLPDMILLGPGSVGETTSSKGLAAQNFPGFIPSKDLLAGSGPGVNVFSYHFYGAVSNRCGGAAAIATTTPEAALSEEWLSRTDATLAFYRALRDQYEPGKPIWLTETGETACGGNRWASTFLDSFRYLDQLGRLAKAGVQVVAHNTLAASDYALLDEETYTPRPDYWAALLWRRLMGTTVLDSGIPIEEGMHVYAHCLRNKPGGVALLVIQNDRTASHSLNLPVAAERYTLSAQQLESAQVLLNGAELSLGANDALPQLKPVATAGGSITFAPATITFLALPKAGNNACR